MKKFLLLMLVLLMHACSSVKPTVDKQGLPGAQSSVPLQGSRYVYPDMMPYSDGDVCIEKVSSMTGNLSCYCERHQTEHEVVVKNIPGVASRCQSVEEWTKYARSRQQQLIAQEKQRNIPMTEEQRTNFLGNMEWVISCSSINTAKNYCAAAGNFDQCMRIKYGNDYKNASKKCY